MKKYLAVVLAFLFLFSAVPASPGKAGSEICRVVIDTDAGSDDAAALMMAASSDYLDILGVTVVFGNVPMENVAENAMMVLEVCGCDAPVCIGAAKPLNKEREQMVSVHGEDGMGDQDLIHPKGKISEEQAVPFLLEQIKAYPDELEIVALGPLTNIALAIQEDPETMSHVRRIWIMGSAGFGQGNATPVAEFNVYSDPLAYDVVLKSGIPLTIVGLDCMTAGTCLTQDEWDMMLAGNEKGEFAAKAFTKLLDFYHSLGSDMGLPDPLAMAALIWPEYVLEVTDCYGVVCTNENEPSYGQVIFYQKGMVYEAMPEIGDYNVQVVSAVDETYFMEHFLSVFTD